MNASIKTSHTMLDLNGKTYQMDFDLGALAGAERVYKQRFGQPCDTYQIISEIFEVQTSAIMALAYGAMISGGEKLSWENFSKNIFTFENFDAIANAVADAVGEMFGEPGDGDEDDEKNAYSRGAK